MTVPPAVIDATVTSTQRHHTPRAAGPSQPGQAPRKVHTPSAVEWAWGLQGHRCCSKPHLPLTPGGPEPVPHHFEPQFIAWGMGRTVAGRTDMSRAQPEALHPLPSRLGQRRCEAPTRPPLCGPEEHEDTQGAEQTRCIRKAGQSEGPGSGGAHPLVCWALGEARAPSASPAGPGGQGRPGDQCEHRPPFLALAAVAESKPGRSQGGTEGNQPGVGGRGWKPAPSSPENHDQARGAPVPDAQGSWRVEKLPR